MVDRLNYFTCTLGQASESRTGKSPSFPSVNALIDVQATRIPKLPAVAFHRPKQTAPDSTAVVGEATAESYDVYTFKDLHKGSRAVAAHLSTNGLGHLLRPKQTVALLAQSTPVFLFTWLALMRTGASVLLLAPQCQPEAVAHLCRTCEAKVLIYDPIYAESANKAVSETQNTIAFEIPFNWEDLEIDFITPPDSQNEWPVVDELDVAYLHHTSGTSGGLPKPIAQTHRAGVGVLPELDGSSKSTFTTTPLYHGGIADCFRSWTSDALIWLFPGSIPITSKNILTSLNMAKNLAQSKELPPVKFFSSVPYVLQMLAGDVEGLKYLQSMDIVGVGGAALPDDAGDDLVKKGVNLVSRFGSAECGFLLSSYRNFEKDKAWQYLRPNGFRLWLKFEPREGNFAELVVSHDWPHLAKRNRDDGSYATADLFAPHPCIDNAWRYHSRADSQLTLITGKKFDPAPLEDSIAAHPLLTDVLIFGNGKQYPGALLWRSDQARSMSSNELLAAIWIEIEKANNSTQNHARVSRSMLVVLPIGTERPEKSSKGTLLRKPVEKKFEQAIETAYDRNEEADELSVGYKGYVEDTEVAKFVQDILKKATGRSDDIPRDVDLFSHGIDSVTCMQVRKILEKRFTKDVSESLPINIVYDCGTINELTKFLIASRKGEILKEEDELGLMNQLVERYGKFDNNPSEIHVNGTNGKSATGRVYLLTGATGALGAHVLDQLLSRSDVSQVICLVRGADQKASHERVSKSLQYRKLRPLSAGEQKVFCTPTKLSEPKLGLSDSEYSDLAGKVDVIIHAAWAVNFSTRLRSFEQDHICGIHNLINFGQSAPKGKNAPHFIFCSSVASVIASQSRLKGISETISRTTSDASPLGYSRSKWVAESICSRAASALTQLQGRMSIVRVGQLCGDTEHGIWNMSEAWPLMLSASRRLGAIPDLGAEPLNWLPVDMAAEALLQIADENLENSAGAENPQIYHVLRQSEVQKPTWNDVIQWVKSEMGPEPMWVVPLSTWVKKLQALDEAHPAQRLLGLWESRAKDDSIGKYEAETDAVRFEQSRTIRTCPKLNSKGQMDQSMFGRMWKWINENQK